MTDIDRLTEFFYLIANYLFHDATKFRMVCDLHRRPEDVIKRLVDLNV